MITDCLSMHRAYMAHTGRECTLFRCRVMKGFSILITLWGVDTLLVSQYLIVNDMKCDYGFKSNNADESSCIACVDRLKVKR